MREVGEEKKKLLGLLIKVFLTTEKKFVLAARRC
jgi:hypothetical protein